MKKDAYYFPHFCNARHDRKIKRLRKELGVEGYGIYFMILEVLREQVDWKYPYADIDLLSDEFDTSTAKIEVVIRKYELFEFDSHNNFFSPRLILYLQPYIEKTERARAAANKRWQSLRANEDIMLIEAKAEQTQSTSNANAYANALEMQNKCNADAMQGKERKGKERINNISNDILFVDGSPSTRIPYQKIVDIFNEICHTFPKVLSVNDSRKKTLKTAWTDNPSMDYFVKLFKMADESTFLSGRDGKWTGCNFDWVIAPKNRVKILEGNYANRDHIKELPF